MGEFRISVSIHSHVRKEGLRGLVYHLTVCTTLEGGFVVCYVTCGMKSQFTLCDFV